MNRRDELRDRYEDALFALLMDEIAEKEGAMAQEENERLKDDPAAAVPEDVDRRCLRTIRWHFTKQKTRAAGRYTVKTLKYALLAVGLAITMFTMAFAASETVRVNTMNLIIRVFEDNTVFEFGQGTNRNPAPQFRAGWLPDGYELVERYSDSIVTWFRYQNSDADFIWVNYSLGEGTSISVDTEDAVTEYVDIHGNKVLLISKERSLQLIWGIENPAAFIQIIGEGVSREDILHVADQLIY